MPTKALAIRTSAAILGTSLMFGAFGLPALALAQYAPVTDVHVIDNTRTATLNIHKFLGDPTGDDNDGSDIGLAPQEGLQAYSAEFKIQRLTNLDVTSVDDWKTFAGLNPLNSAGMTLGETQTVTTDAATGTVAVGNLPLGFYLVTETNTDAEPGRTTAAPFLISLPLSQTTATEGATSTEWSYNVHVYPKNQIVGVEKDVEDKDMQAGQDVTYTIKGEVPAAPGNEDQVLNYFRLSDGYNANQLTIKKDTVNVTIGAQELVKDTDYKITEEGEGTAAAKLHVTLTKGGLVKLTDARRADASLKVTLTLKATVTNDTQGDVVNEGLLVPPTIPASKADYEGDPTNPPTTPPDAPGEPNKDNAESKYGTLTLRKTDGNTDAIIAASAATFELYKCKPGTAELVSNDKVTVNGVSEWETNTDDSDTIEDGTLTIKGIQLEDWYNGAAQTDTFDYCVIETKAPDGYELNPKPINVSLTTQTPTVDDVKYVKTADVKNFPNNGGFELPVTGQTGTLWIITIGGALTVGAVAYTARRKKDEKALLS